MRQTPPSTISLLEFVGRYPQRINHQHVNKLAINIFIHFFIISPSKFVVYSSPSTNQPTNDHSAESDRSEMTGGRTVGVAVDFSACSKKALRWAVDNVVRHGDDLILISVLPQAYYEEGEMQLWETTGSPFVPLTELSDPNLMKKYGVNPDPETLDILNTAATQKEIVVVMKIYWGDPREKICEAIEKIPLSCLIIGNRGLGKIKRAFMGSVSNHVVNSAACPVTVVKNVVEE